MSGTTQAHRPSRGTSSTETIQLTTGRITVSQLIVELRKLQRQGLGDLPVSEHQYGASHCMPVARIVAYPGNHVVLCSPNPSLMWPTGEEQESVCSLEDALYNDVAHRDLVQACKDSGGSF